MQIITSGKVRQAFLVKPGDEVRLEINDELVCAQKFRSFEKWITTWAMVVIGTDAIGFFVGGYDLVEVLIADGATEANPSDYLDVLMERGYARFD